MERNRLDAEARVIAKKLGAEKLGLTWVKALLAEFKKPYMQEVSFDLLPEGGPGAGVCCSDRQTLTKQLSAVPLGSVFSSNLDSFFVF